MFPIIIFKIKADEKKKLRLLHNMLVFIKVKVHILPTKCIFCNFMMHKCQHNIQAILSEQTLEP